MGHLTDVLLQREMFDTARSMGKLLETSALRGQIARFLYKHKNKADCGQRPFYKRHA
jgi:hypothetical protein